MRGDTFTRFVKSLKAAVPIDKELIAQSGGFGIEGMIDQALAEAKKCATPPILDVELSTNDNSIIRRSPDRAIEDVAAGRWSFVNPRDARRYAPQVEALKAKMATDKQRAKSRAVEAW